MIVFEKLRAICQQTISYKKIVPSFSPRARDFYDIHLIMEMNRIDPTTNENISLILNIFQAKKVPIQLIKEIKNNQAIHADNWQSVKDTISPYERLEDFQYYFDYVVNKFSEIKFP